jgi:hypothetical protein
MLGNLSQIHSRVSLKTPPLATPSMVLVPVPFPCVAHDGLPMNFRTSYVVGTRNRRTPPGPKAVRRPRHVLAAEPTDGTREEFIGPRDGAPCMR